MTTTPAPVVIAAAGFGTPSRSPSALTTMGSSARATGPRNQRRSPMVLNATLFRPDVELPVRGVVYRPVRQPAWISLSITRGSITFAPAAPARGAGIIPPTERDEWPDSDFPATTKPFVTRCSADSTTSKPTGVFLAIFPGGSRWSANALRCSDGQSPNSSSRSFCGRADRPIRPWRPRGHDRVPEARGAALLRPGGVRGMPAPWLVSRTRCSATSRRTSSACRRSPPWSNMVFDGPGANEVSVLNR